MLTLDKIYHAAFVLKDVARKTDLIDAPKLSKDCQLIAENRKPAATGTLRCAVLTIRSANFRPKKAPRASLPARPATMRRVWRWPPPAVASRASFACRTVPPS